MCSDYPVKDRSNSEVKEIAKRARKSFAVLTIDGRVDLDATLRQSHISTEYGLKQLSFSIDYSDQEEEEGRTEYSDDSVNISLSAKSHRLLLFGDGRARNTAAHEIGHAIMHDGTTLFRHVRNQQCRWIEPFRSAEHQTKVFAPAFLIDDNIAVKLGSSAEISVVFGVSLESAEIYLRELKRPDEKRALAKRLSQLSRSLEDERSEEHQLRYLHEPCSNCGHKKLFPVGTKYMCEECDRVFDRFQDGDG